MPSMNAVGAMNQKACRLKGFPPTQAAVPAASAEVKDQA